MPTNLLTATDQIQLGTLLMGPGTSYTIQTDWNPYAAPDFEAKVANLSWEWGALGGFDTYATRKLKFTVLAQGTSAATMRSLMDDVSYAFTPTNAETELAFQNGSDKFLYYGRTRGAHPTAVDRGFNRTWMECRFEALDPRYYRDPLVSATTNVSNATGTYTGTVITNAGVIDSSAGIPWDLYIRPSTGITLTNPRFILSPWSPSFSFVEVLTTVSAGFEMWIDGRRRKVIRRNFPSLNNPEDVSNLVSYDTKWFRFPPRTNVTYELHHDGGGSGTSPWVLEVRGAYT